MRFIRLLLQYDGTNYHGWQTQKAGTTIQDVIRERIYHLTGERVRLTGASRTDAGVHALDQVAAFATGSNLPAEVIARALNATLPYDIRVLRAEETESSFHPRFDARQKSYFYLLSPARTASAFLCRYVWYLKADIDVSAMAEASRTLLGEHDFTSFRGSGCGAKSPVRNIIACDVSPLSEMAFMTASLGGEFVKVRIEANAFLRHMARNIVGTLVEVGKGRMSASEFTAPIEACDRTKAGPTAPARGLFLEKITY